MVERRRILIVDDQARARSSLRVLVNAWLQTRASEAATGAEAVRQVEELHPDVVLMDARMPEMDGIEATRLIKARWPEVHVIVLSLYPEYRSQALAAGAEAFIGKGEPPELLREMLARAIKGRPDGAP